MKDKIFVCISIVYFVTLKQKLNLINITFMFIYLF